MTTHEIKWALRFDFTGSQNIHKHLHPGRSPLMISDGVKFVRDHCNAWFLLDTILCSQSDQRLKNIKYQIWILQRLKKDLNLELTVREDTGKKPILSKIIAHNEFPLDSITIWVIDATAILPTEY